MIQFSKIFIYFFVAVLILSAGLVNAHGVSGAPEGMMKGSEMMMRMMDMTHGNIDKANAVKCDSLGDEDFMEHGETMMEEMMGHEDHERVEEAMEKDMADHDSMHAMMGMWATGCVGDEVAASVGERYGMRFTAGERGGVETSFNWPLVAITALIFAVGGWIVGRFVGNKTI